MSIQSKSSLQLQDPEVSCSTYNIVWWLSTKIVKIMPQGVTFCYHISAEFENGCSQLNKHGHTIRECKSQVSKLRLKALLFQFKLHRLVAPYKVCLHRTPVNKTFLSPGVTRFLQTCLMFGDCETLYDGSILILFQISTCGPYWSSLKSHIIYIQLYILHKQFKQYLNH